MEKFLSVLAILSPVISAVLVAIISNWDKINSEKRNIKDVKQITSDTYKLASENREDMETVKAQMKKISTAQRTGLQTMILEKCKRINNAISKGDVNYEEELKQLVILYREYHLCGYNSQGKLYFNDTIAKASEQNNVMVREIMNTYFSEYDPSEQGRSNS